MLPHLVVQTLIQVHFLTYRYCSKDHLMSLTTLNTIPREDYITIFVVHIPSMLDQVVATNFVWCLHSSGATSLVIGIHSVITHFAVETNRSTLREFSSPRSTRRAVLRLWSSELEFLIFRR